MDRDLIERLRDALSNHLDVDLWVDEPEDLEILVAIQDAVLQGATPVYQAWNPATGEGSNRLHLNRGHAKNHARHTWGLGEVRRGQIIWDK